MITLFIAGDFLAKNIGKLTISSTLSSYIKKSDIAVCNFEAPIVTDAPPIPKSGPSHCQSPLAPAFLEEEGFNLIQLSNNHMCDFGQEGVRLTKKAFVKSKFVGAGTFHEAYSPSVFIIDGKKVAFLSFSHKEFGCLEDETDDSSIGVSWIFHPVIENLIKSIKKDVDHLVVLVHAGIELIDIPLPEYRTHYRRLIDWGADAVVGSHPHVPQGWETYNGKPIFYSLGNFYFESGRKRKPEYWDKGLALQLSFDDASITFKVIYTIFEHNLSIDIYDSKEYHNHILTLCSLLKDENRYNKELTKIMKSNVEYYKYIFLVSTNGFAFLPSIRYTLSLVYNIFRKNHSLLLLNCLQCESHRFLIERMFKFHVK